MFSCDESVKIPYWIKNLKDTVNSLQFFILDCNGNISCEKYEKLKELGFQLEELILELDQN